MNERDRAELARLQQQTKEAAEATRRALEKMQTALDDAWEWYEGTRDETAAALEGDDR